MSSWKKPTQKQIDLVSANLKGNLKQQFFAKLENPEWFDILKQKNLLCYSTNTNDYGQEYKEWTAFPYLLKIASEIPDQIMQFIQPMLQKIEESQNPDWWLIQRCISLSTKLPDRYLMEIMSMYNESLKKLDRLGWQDDDILKQLLTRLKGISKDLALDICRSLLSIKLIKRQYLDLGTSFSPYAKIVNSGYGYEQIMKIVNTVFSDSSEEILRLYVSIIAEDMVNDLSKEEMDDYYYTDYIHRSAIEKHSQDAYKKNEPLYILVSEIRDLSFELFQNANEKSNQNVFELLESSNCPTMIRIILYLLRVSDKCKNNLLVKYLTNKDIFNNNNYHHEYFLLIQEKFNQLPKYAQKIILNYIDEGPNGKYYETDDQISSEQKKNAWRLHKLTPIKKYLSQDILDKYRAILYNDKGEEVEYSNHPEMLSWMTSREIVSPLDTEELSEKSIEEIVKFINYWKSDNITFHRIGLAENLRKDSISNPDKYLNHLDKLRKIQYPIYIHYILSGLRDAKTITNEQWQNIIVVSQWIIKQNGESENYNKFSDVDNDWYHAKAVVADLLSKAFRYKENLQDFPEKYIEKAFNILKRLCFTEDRYLEEKSKERNVKYLDDYLTSAINSLHGKSVECLVLYLIWNKNNDKPLDSIAIVIDELFKHPKYLETCAIFAHMLPWIHYALPTVTENNIDNLFPEYAEKRHLFEAAFATFVDYPQMYDGTFPLLKNKFIYVLKNQIYSNNEQTQTEDSQVSKLLAIYYGRGLFDLNSEIIKLLFNNHNNYQKQVEFINYIGFSLWDRDSTNQTVMPEVINRFVKLWEWLLIKIQRNESEYKDVLAQFERWYQCGQFDSEWIINQLHHLVMDYDVPIKLFMIEDNLLKDLPKFPRKVFEIAAKIICSKQQRLYISNKSLVKEMVQYIHENDFPDDPTLKSDKDDFINKYLENCEGWQVDTEAEKLSKYLETK